MALNERLGHEFASLESLHSSSYFHSVHLVVVSTLYRFHFSHTLPPSFHAVHLGIVSRFFEACFFPFALLGLSNLSSFPSSYGVDLKNVFYTICVILPSFIKVLYILKYELLPVSLSLFSGKYLAFVKQVRERRSG